MWEKLVFLRMARGVLEGTCLKNARMGCVLARPGRVSMLHWLLQVSLDLGQAVGKRPSTHFCSGRILPNIPVAPAHALRLKV